MIISELMEGKKFQYADDWMFIKGIRNEFSIRTKSYRPDRGLLQLKLADPDADRVSIQPQPQGMNIAVVITTGPLSKGENTCRCDCNRPEGKPSGTQSGNQ